jgi:hypothetical protein
MHGNAAFGRCATCHNGTTATGMNAGHIPTNNTTCAGCHTIRGWTPARMDHTAVAGSACSTCHNGSYAAGKSANHIATTLECDFCHSTRAWTPAVFDHSQVAPGTCSSCHDGTTATGKPATHLATSLECDSCHSTRGWTPAGFAHSSPFYPNHGRTISCNRCHQGTPETAANAWSTPAYKPDCAGCHAGDYKPGEHKNASVSELRNCAGTCHKSSPEHRVTDRDWD